MLRHTLLAALCALVLAACQASDEPDIAEQPTASIDVAEIVERAPAAPMELLNARGFMTENPVAPPTATLRAPDGRGRDEDGRPYGHDLLGKTLPTIVGTLSDGTAFNSTMLERWTVIRVWGVWCHDSRNDAPYAEALRTAIDQDPDLDFMTIHVPASETRLDDDEMFSKYGSLEAYFQKHGFDWPSLIDTDAGLREKLAVDWTPSYFVVSTDGFVRGFRTDLKVAGDEAVKDLIRDIAELRAVTSLELSPRRALTMGPKGAGYLGAKTPFALTSVEPIFPGLEVITTEDLSFRLLNSDEEHIYTIEPDWTGGLVGWVSTRHDSVTGPLGERIGAFKLADLPPASQENCQEIDVDDQERIACSDSDSNEEMQFWRYFEAKPPHMLFEMTFDLQGVK